MADDLKPRRASGYTGEYPTIEPRKPSLHQRLVGGEFRIQRAPLGDPGAKINVGMGGPPAGGAIDIDATRPRPATPALGTTAAAPTRPAAAAPVANKPDFSNVRGSSAVQGPTLQPGTLNTFTGSDGQTRAVQPATNPNTPPPPRPAAQLTAQPSLAPQVRESTQAAVAGQRDLARTGRADAAEFLNPMSNSAEIMRRFQNSQNSYFNKGSPQARRMAGEAILGQLGAQNQASAMGQQAGSATLQQGVGLEAGAMEGGARRALDAQTFNADDSYRRDQLAAEQGRATGTLVRATDGSTSVLRNDGSVSTLRNEAGDPIQTPDMDRGALTPAALLSSYTTQAQAISDGLGTPEDKAAQLATLRADPLYSQLFSQQRAQIPVGTERGGYRYRGGDPANKASWERIN